MGEVTVAAALRGPAAATGGRDDAARALWAEHYPRLAGWTKALVGDTDVAHDVAAEAFARLLGTWLTVREPKAFLYTVAGNLARDHWRRTDRDRRLVDRVGAVTPTSASASDPWLRDLVERLPDRLRMPVLLHNYADLPVSEVATALRKSEGTVKRALSEGRAALLAAVESSVESS
ncbi:MAG: RNA polymerase sigma factor [Mycobacteriales bacterium]|nr:RNA polymerase sigma factor [Mycobacteriales bacterium]